MADVAYFPGLRPWGPALRDSIGVPPAPPPDPRPGRGYVIREWVENMLIVGWFPGEIKTRMKDMRGGLDLARGPPDGQHVDAGRALAQEPDQPAGAAGRGVPRLAGSLR